MIVLYDSFKYTWKKIKNYHQIVVTREMSYKFVFISPRIIYT